MGSILSFTTKDTTSFRKKNLYFSQWHHSITIKNCPMSIIVDLLPTEKLIMTIYWKYCLYSYQVLHLNFLNFLNTSIEAIHGSRDIELLFGTYISCDLQVNESHIIKEYITGTWIFLSNTLLYTCNTKAILNLLNANRGGWIFRSRAFFLH